MCEIMAKWGLTVHIGHGGKKSKTELMFFPSTLTIARWRNEPMEIENGDDSPSDTVVIRKKKSMNLETKYDNAPETEDIAVDERGGVFSFTKAFLHLGSKIDFLIDDTTDVKNRISKANKSMGALKFIWDALEVPLTTKIKLHQATPMNLMLWGSENWGGNKADIAMMNAFYHKSIHRILVIIMGRAKEEEITNDDIIRRFGGIELMRDTWRKRQLLFIGCIVRLKEGMCPQCF